MQMTRSKMARESRGDSLRSQFISPEDVAGLFKGIITALPTVNEGSEGLCCHRVTADTTEEAKRGAEP